MKTNKELEQFNIAKEEYGNNPNDWYTYGDDATKAQWYTNLWNRMNGDSTVKSKAGMNGDNYQTMDGRLLNSDSWIVDALSQGMVSLQQVSVDKTVISEIPDQKTPTVYNIKGIDWNDKIYTNCTDLKQVDDEQAITKAEAIYEKKTKEIAAQDNTLTTQMRKIDSERSVLTSSYSKIKQQLETHISKSFNVFGSG